MLDTILNSLKGEISEGLSSKLGLSDKDVDQVVDSSKQALEKTVAEESNSNGLGNLLNLFSKEENTQKSNNLLGNLGGNLVSSLVSNGFSSSKSSSIKDMILPIIMNLVSSKIGGNSGLLGGLMSSFLGGGKSSKNEDNDGGIADKASDFVKGLF